MDFLNSLASKTSAAESVSFHSHPLGSWNGQITSTEKKVVNGRPVWELIISTARGTAAYNIWGFSPQDIQAGQADMQAREKMVKNIARIKRTFKELGNVFPDEIIDSMGWNIGDPCVIGVLDRGLLHHRNCRIVVKADNKDPNKRVVFLNPPENTPDAPEDQPRPASLPPDYNAKRASTGTPPGYNYGGEQGQSYGYGQTPPPRQVQPTMPPGMNQSLDDIPF